MSATPTYLQLGYIDKKIEQSMRWANGVPSHDTTYDECCADFSCCHPDLFEQDSTKRFAHHAKFMDEMLERRKTVLAGQS